MAKKDQPKTEDENLEIDAAAEDGISVEEVTIEADAGAQDWKEQFEAAKRSAEEAETKRVEAERVAQQRADEIDRIQRENLRTKSEVVSAEMLAIKNAIANTDHERSDAEQEYVLAMEAGDFKSAAAAQSKMAAIAVKAQRIKEGEAELERRAEAAKAQADPLEQYVSQLSPQSASWIRKHPETVSDASKRDQLQRAHYKALGEGIRPDTNEYFQHMDVEMGYAARPAPLDDIVDDPAPARQAPPPAAPVSRGGAAQAPASRNNVIRLTAAQREIAAACGLSDVEYAKQLQAIQRENATTH